MKKFCIILSLLIMFCLISCTTTPEDKKNEIIHTVTFDSNGGSLVETQYVKDLEYAVKPANPTKEGYDFIGWLYNGDNYPFDSSVTKSMTLVAYWVESGSLDGTEGLIYNDMGEYYEFAGIGTSKNTNIVIPAEYNGKPVKGIGYDSFDEVFHIETIVLPDTIEYISDEGFKDISNLVSINLPFGLKTIGACAFEGCESLKEIKIPDSVTEIKYYAFSSCINLNKVNISEFSDLKTISNGVFDDCQNLKEIFIPKGVTFIGEDVFLRCKSLEKITVSEYNNNYSSVDGVLYNKNQDTIIKYPAAKKDLEFHLLDSVKTVLSDSFGELRILEKLYLNDGVETIKNDAIFESQSIKELYIPKGIKNMGPYSFNSANFEEIIYYCEEVSKPAQWHDYWISVYASIVWDYKNTDEVAAIYKALPGTHVPTVKIPIGTIPTKPADPTYDGHKFLGWFIDNKEYNFDYPLNENTIIRAKWEQIPIDNSNDRLEILDNNHIIYTLDIREDHGHKSYYIDFAECVDFIVPGTRGMLEIVITNYLKYDMMVEATFSTKKEVLDYTKNEDLTDVTKNISYFNFNESIPCASQYKLTLYWCFGYGDGDDSVDTNIGVNPEGSFVINIDLMYYVN